MLLSLLSSILSSLLLLSVSVQLFMQPYWRWLVTKVPLWLAPNLITFVGLLINTCTTLPVVLLDRNAQGLVSVTSWMSVNLICVGSAVAVCLAVMLQHLLLIVQQTKKIGADKLMYISTKLHTNKCFWLCI